MSNSTAHPSRFLACGVTSRPSRATPRYVRPSHLYLTTPKGNTLAACSAAKPKRAPRTPSVNWNLAALENGA